MTNFFQGLARGPIDHEASSVINVIANGAIEMGSSVLLNTTIPPAELLPRVEESTSPAITDNLYGIAVGGDTDGIYSTTGAPSGDDSTRATASAGQGVVVVTQGRCLARVNGSGPAITIGLELSASTTAGVLIPAVATSRIIAIALQPSTLVNDIIAVDVQRGGIF